MLLHICCAPCSILSWKFFQERGARLCGYFFNPNIHPYREFTRRISSLRALVSQEKMEVIFEEEYLLEDFLCRVMQRGKDRCHACYEMRLNETARIAREKGFEYFSTTLLISPYQKQELVKEVGEDFARIYGIQFVYEDLRPLFRDSWRLAREKGFYTQGYCGCIFSEKERYLKKKIFTSTKGY